MCDGYLQIDYSDAVAEEPYGIFAHDRAFTVEAIITPFDINGYGFKLAGSNSPAGAVGVADSIKTMPTVQAYNTTASHYQSHTYRDEANRITDKMVLFHNDNLQLYLQNSTLTTQNQPAEYKIGMIVNASSDDTLVTTNPVIKSSLRHVGETATSTVYHGEDSTVKYEAASANVASSGHTSGQATFTHDGANHADDHFFVGQELFTLSGQVFTSIGKVASVASATKVVTLDAVVNTDLDSETLYTHAKREATYLLNSFHIAWAMDITNGRMTIYLNGDVVATKIHTDYGSGSFPFYIAAEDTYIGQDPSTGTSTQFMGQVHEFAFLDNYKTEFNSLFTLATNYRDTLLYYRFEEIDE